MNRIDLQNLANVRLAEVASSLLLAGHPNGAYYLAGYSVECALKAVIASQTQLHDFPDKQRAIDSFVHDLERSCKSRPVDRSVAGGSLSGKLSFCRGIGPLSLSGPETARYNVYSIRDAEAIIGAVGDRNEGVLSCDHTEVLVDIDVKTGEQIVAALSSAGMDMPKVAMWATFADYYSPRFVLASTWFDNLRSAPRI